MVEHPSPLLHMPAEDLLDVAVGLPRESEAQWELVMEAHRRGDEPTWRAARDLCRSANPARRWLGVQVLAQFGVASGAAPTQRPFHAASVALLQEVLAEEVDPTVLGALGVAAGHLRSPELSDAVLALAGHVDAEVRDGVAFAATGLNTPEAVRALARLAGDADAEVRATAVEGLADPQAPDAPELREALRAVLDGDGDPGLRELALWGLARRGERAVIPATLRLLLDPDLWQLPERVEEAAVALATWTADPRFVPFVQEMVDRYGRATPPMPVPPGLLEAQRRCERAAAG